MQNLFLFNNIKDGTLLPQVIHGGIGTKAGGVHEFSSFLFCCSSFRLQLIAICCNRRERCKQYTSYVTFSHAVNTHSLLHITLHGSRVCWRASRHLHSRPCVRLHCLFSLCSSRCSFPCVSPISSSST